MPSAKPSDHLEHGGEENDRRGRNGDQDDDDNRGEDGDECLGDQDMVEALIGEGV